MFSKNCIHIFISGILDDWNGEKKMRLYNYISDYYDLLIKVSVLNLKIRMSKIYRHKELPCCSNAFRVHEEKKCKKEKIRACVYSREGGGIGNLSEKKSHKCLNYAKKKKELLFFFFYLMRQHSHSSRTEVNFNGISCPTIEDFKTKVLLYHLL